MSKKKRGFASMDPKKVKEITSMGGKAAHAKGVAHEFDSEEGKAARRRSTGRPRAISWFDLLAQRAIQRGVIDPRISGGYKARPNPR